MRTFYIYEGGQPNTVPDKWEREVLAQALPRQGDFVGVPGGTLYQVAAVLWFPFGNPDRPPGGACVEVYLIPSTTSRL